MLALELGFRVFDTQIKRLCDCDLSLTVFYISIFKTKQPDAVSLSYACKSKWSYIHQTNIKKKKTIVGILYNIYFNCLRSSSHLMRSISRHCTIIINIYNFRRQLCFSIHLKLFLSKSASLLKLWRHGLLNALLSNSVTA